MTDRLALVALECVKTARQNTAGKDFMPLAKELFSGILDLLDEAESRQVNADKPEKAPPVQRRKRGRPRKTENAEE